MQDLFWNHSHPLTSKATELMLLVPMVGEVEGAQNAKLERFRRITNAYYRFHNDGTYSNFFRNKNADDVLATAVKEAYEEQSKLGNITLS